MRIFISPEAIKAQKGIRIPPDKSRYLVTVLRRKKGDRITVIDGRGKTYEAEVSDMARESVSLDILHELPSEGDPLVPLVLCQGALKGEKMDLVVQKATELGITEIIPLLTTRCLVRETRKLKRWRKIAEEAAEQCGRATIPVVHEPREFIHLPEDGTARGEGEKALGCIFWEEGGVPLTEAVRTIGLQSSRRVIQMKAAEPLPSPVFLLIGPEGGFTADEVSLAEERGLIRTTLGKRILRAETASIVSVALVQFLLEEARSRS